MSKISKKLLSSTVIVLLMLLVVCSTYSYLAPIAHASPSTLQQEGVTILSNTVGLDLSKYTLMSHTYPQSNSSFKGITQQEDIEYQLISQDNRLNVFCTFANDNLQMLQILDNVGSPIFAKPQSVDAVGAAKDFLKSYQTYTGSSIYGQLESTLGTVDGSKNLTQTSGNTKLEVCTASNGYSSFKWTYTVNNILAPTKFVALGFNNNSLAYFVDNWQLFTIGSTKVTISKNDAQTIGLNAAKTHFANAPLDDDAFEFENFNQSNVAFAALIFDRSSYGDATHNGDSLTLYPVWRVGVQLNKWYGDLYGIEVDMYADTGQIISAKEALSSLHPQDYLNAPANANNVVNQTSILNTAQALNKEALTVESNPSMIMWLLLLTSLGILSTVSVFSIKKKAYSHKLFPFFKTKGMKLSVHTGNMKKLLGPVNAAILICIIALPSLVFSVSISPVKATTPAGTAVVWGSESIGQLFGQTQPYFYWRKEYNEIMVQQNEAQWIEDDFTFAGWAGTNGHVINRQGDPGSYKSNIIDDLTFLKNSGATNVAIVDFDHGIGTSLYSGDPGVFHYMFEDEEGNYIGNYPGSYQPNNAVYDNQIYTLTNEGEVIFAFISTCMSADYYNSLGAIPPSDPYYSVLQGHLHDGIYRGMAYAFTHRLVGLQMSSDGYNSADAGSQVYIGFPIGSPSLSQWLPDPEVSGWLYADWVPYFFSALLRSHMTVHNALDYASGILWGTNFNLSPLSRYSPEGGFEPYWYIYGQENEWPTSWMTVFGNANIQLPYQQITPPPPYSLDVYASDEYWGHCDLPVNVQFDGGWVGTAPVSIQVATAGYHTVTVDSYGWDPRWSMWMHLAFISDNHGNVWYTNEASVPIYSDTTVWAYYCPE